MPISPEKVRELAAHGEHSRLDFKREMYDWTKPATNAELAKDLMAIANELSADAEPGYILVGVEDDGTIVGIPSSLHLDDADLHQKVKHFLNETPQFSYSAADVDGLSIGVFEIRPGRRPYFPLKDSGTVLRRRVPFHRNGTSTDVASPLMVIEWAKQDDPDSHRLRLLQLREHEVRAKPRGHFAISSRSSGPTEIRFGLLVQNMGQYPFEVSVCRWRLVWTPEFRADIERAIADRELGGDTPEIRTWRAGTPDVYAPPSGAVDFGGTKVVAPSKVANVDVGWTMEMARQHFAECLIPIDGFKPSWATYHFEVPVKGDLGDGVLKLSSNSLGGVFEANS